MLSGCQDKEPATVPAEGTPLTSLDLDQYGRDLTQAAREGMPAPVMAAKKRSSALCRHFLVEPDANFPLAPLTTNSRRAIRDQEKNSLVFATMIT